MRLKLACADFAFPLLTLDQALDVIALLGFDGVDIGLFEGRGSLWPSRELKNISRSARRLRKQLGDRGLKLADMFLHPGSGFMELAVNHPDPKSRRKAREIFERCVDYTVACGGRHLSYLPGVAWPGEAYNASLRRCADELAWRTEKAGRVGVVASIEAHLGSVVSKPPLVRRLIDMSPGLTLTLDYGHFTTQGIPDRAVQPLIAHASHFHARCGRKHRLQCALKDNAIDFTRILREMKRTSYRGYIGLEYVWIDWQHCNEVDNLSETILLRDHLRRASP